MSVPSRLAPILSLTAIMLTASVGFGQDQPQDSNSATNTIANSTTNAAAGSTTNDVLLIDSLGRLVTVSTNQVPSGYRPPSDLGVNDQIPTYARGTLAPMAILQRARNAISHAEFFPAVPPGLMPYLASQDEYGNTALTPNPMFSYAPIEPWVDGAKYQLSRYGLRYSLQQTFDYINMSNVKQGSDTMAEYTLDMKSKWAIYDVPTVTAGWLSAQVQAKSGLGTAASTQSVKSNLGTLVNPTVSWSGTNNVRVPELAWQQSLFNGHFVAVAGVVSQRNYMDDNAYANSGRSKFMNAALINSQVLPLGRYDFGFNLQWQPLEEWYAMVGGNAGNASAGLLPWIDYSWKTWSLPIELGYAPTNVFGLGPGIYRIQPFAAGVNGTTGGGLCFDMQQKLGPDSPFGWFGRFGFGNAKVSTTADREIGTGFVAQGPFTHLLFHRTSNDFLGSGFVWSQPAATTKPVIHENEYIWETVYVIQLTPTVKLMPDFQQIWDPAFHNTRSCSVFQLQLALAW
ncbi:MAG TPA: carbohydrate porin [Candidatus Acidoferrales bacterium]|nr:carbohydrate porin [Candidatus Acidoferrales bacterium]